ncbi:PTS sugar transporter subunit IIB [Kineothrix sp. MB12-C1]|uniref:PTS sugar transporter subunit IIB n=1 Tax=Kineothrix sp. MB12-C1 TaxID=3070215 RepID=UPI0027D22199|nr:PTS sugar transporter subunit IIB [Kineothrix sp. MB12-C1]WMC92138.1 PTS sugar transporter subunit IIB [Kineothrix sp. MB12-C1]
MEILFVCGGGASSSFIAQNVRKAGKSTGVDVNVEAIGETELEDYIEGKDIILIGPHLKYLEDDLAEIINEYNVPYAFISEQDYAKMNGESILEQAFKLTEE